MADKRSSEAYKRIEEDLEFYFKHERSMSDEVKLDKLNDINERIRGIAYMLGMNDEKLIEIRERIHQIEKPIIERLEEQTQQSEALKLTIDCSDALKGLKAVQREARKTTQALRELEMKKNKYLVIELDKLGDVPKVLYKGKEITQKEFIDFQWKTKTDVPGSGCTKIMIDYFEKNEKDCKPTLKGIRIEK